MTLNIRWHTPVVGGYLALAVVEHMTVDRKPWERRLEDLSQILFSCGASYFKPDIFRQNVNHFLQTARTVTFIIQKNKESIAEFSDWYESHVVRPWKDDKIMQWAKDARNSIEKEGDLELHSTLEVTLLFSYLAEDDVHVQCGRRELLDATIARLVAIARHQLPSGVRDAAALRVERTWVTSTLPSHELLWGLGYVYSRLYECTESLGHRLGRKLPESIPHPSDVTELRDASRQVEFVKLKNMSNYRINTERVDALPADRLPEAVTKSLGKLKNELVHPVDFQSMMEYHSHMAHAIFEQWGNHVPILFMFNSDWAPVDMVTFAPDDQAEKYFFWRAMGERIELEKIHAMVFTSETWLRKIEGYPLRAISELPIIGEKLQVTGIDRECNYAVRSWEIRRSQAGGVTLEEDVNPDNPREQPFFLVPAMRSMGYEPSFMTARSGVD